MCAVNTVTADADIQCIFMLQQETSMIGIMDGQIVGQSDGVSMSKQEVKPSCRSIFLLAGLSSYL